MTESMLRETDTPFFSCDWGTTSFRLRLVTGRDLRCLGELREDAGVKGIQATLPEGATAADRAAVFAGYLRGRVDVLSRRHRWNPAGARVMVSGMASSSVGWRELPYAWTPFPLDGRGTVLERVPVGDDAGGGLKVWLVSGIRTATDILRGEECEVLGATAAGFLGTGDGPQVMVLPGTHAKHVWIQGGAITGFQTYMTGELCDLLGRHSLLRVSVRWPPEDPEPDAAERDAFAEGVRLAGEGGLGRHLFRVRTRTVLDGVPASVNTWFLSGLAIGDEVRALVRRPEAPRVVLAGSPRFSTAYRLALEVLGGRDRLVVLDPEAMDQVTLRAHARLLARVEGGSSGG